MGVEELKKFIEEGKDDKEVQAYLASLAKPTLDAVKSFVSSNSTSDEVKAFLASLMTPEGVRGWLEGTPEGKKLLQSITDQAVTRGIETFKEKTLPGLVKAEYDKLHPPETEDQKRLRELEIKIEQTERERVRSELKTKAIAALTQQGLPAKTAEKIVGYLVADDETATMANVELLTQEWSQSVTSAVEERFKKGGRHTPEGEPKPEPTKITREELAKMKPDEIVKAQREGKLDHLLKGE